MFTLPNILTFCRILLIPVVVFAFFTQHPWGKWVAVLAFCSACLTDYLDGYFARLLSQSSRLGQFLDPVADKMLVATTLILLSSFDKISRISVIPAVIILCREILVSGLREHLSDFKVQIPVSYLAKWKTAFQMSAITLLLLTDLSPISLKLIGEVMLWVSALLTLATGYTYLKASFRHFNSDLPAQSDHGQ